MTRLTYDDDLFLRMECVLDVPVVNQIVWRFTGPIDSEVLDSTWRNLAGGPIDRAVHRVSVPGARDRWVRAASTLPLLRGARAIAVHALAEWMEERAAVPLDPTNGPVWQLAYTDLETGGSALSLVASHVVGDGGALTSAAIAALRGPSDPDDFASAFDTAPTSDLRDAAGQLRAAASGTARALGRTVRGVLPGAGTPSASKAVTHAAAHKSPVAAQSAGEFSPSTVVVDCPTDEWLAAASRAGGSANSLLVAVALGILAAGGRVDESDAVKVSLPVSTRIPGDTRANATSGVSIVVDGGRGYLDDLRPIRQDSKAAFRALADTTRSTTFELTKPLMQMLPDAVVARAAKSATAPLCLCSNLGARGSALRSVGGSVAESVAMRSITQNTTAELLRRTKGGVSVWWNTCGETATLCVTGLDPDLYPSREHLKNLIADEYTRWQLTPTFW
ncbi:hypothetical protein CH300_26025 [Rhodococcus sp. 15-1154-1]|nr:hypothetical protein [Rhodococcus sp. 15-1154-1]OZE97641.1 hypothetical protein CH300_26025 [Rhodococcus sp. 15-1154-1]